MDVKILKMVLEFTKNQFPYKLNYLLNTDSFFWKHKNGLFTNELWSDACLFDYRSIISVFDQITKQLERI
jgi:hypothetical protein